MIIIMYIIRDVGILATDCVITRTVIYVYYYIDACMDTHIIIIYRGDHRWEYTFFFQTNLTDNVADHPVYTVSNNVRIVHCIIWYYIIMHIIINKYFYLYIYDMAAGVQYVFTLQERSFIGPETRSRYNSRVLYNIV